MLFRSRALLLFQSYKVFVNGQGFFIKKIKKILAYTVRDVITMNKDMDLRMGECL